MEEAMKRRKNKRIWFCENLIVPSESGFAPTKRAAQEFVCGMFSEIEGRFDQSDFFELVKNRQAARAIPIMCQWAIAQSLLTRCDEIRYSEEVRHHENLSEMSREELYEAAFRLKVMTRKLGRHIPNLRDRDQAIGWPRFRNARPLHPGRHAQQGACRFALWIESAVEGRQMKPIPEMSPTELGHAARQLKRMIRNLGKLIPVADRNDFERASGLAICPLCGLEYFDHPPVGADELLYVGCDGKMLKL
jgi:hypothetical protein